MKTLPACDATIVEMVDDIVTIRQSKNYTYQQISFPVELWGKLQDIIQEEINNPINPIQSGKTAEVTA